jgi:hypothetical protein
MILLSSSGDALMCIPPWRLSIDIIETINDYTKKDALPIMC